ncbi:hypothetical protein AXF42_Ash016366 [Apostasia shenzhenica]|uniref:N-alpha-acetyltransferase 35, NatC auxiliary subunit n=1 Tax=Apostasia shenzhenica TaxID=1088818 RepID=A0A2H9ZZX4_9ASPA|nr:hypothetical protein AXF42_Ash016366 [Apostasia shenzhenica]
MHEALISSASAWKQDKFLNPRCFNSSARKPREKQPVTRLGSSSRGAAGPLEISARKPYRLSNLMEGCGGVVIPGSIPPGDAAVWADASPLIAAACNGDLRFRDLHDGELIHCENFSLFAAMSALEIMDPRMDSGMEGSGFHSVEEAIENGVAPIPLSLDRKLDVQRCIDVMDHLLACEATWHKGHSLAQTVFSCVYLLRIERTSSHALLHAFCRVTKKRKCGRETQEKWETKGIFAEEDFFTMAYGLPLKGDGDEKFLSLLNSVEETISRQLRACKAQGTRNQPSDDIESLQIDSDLEEGYCRALLCRLRFRKHFYHALVCMRKPLGRGLELARKHVALCLSELASMSKSVEFLRSNACISQGETECGTTASGQHPLGFDATLNCKLSAPTPPRAIQILDWEQVSRTIKYFEKLLSDLDAVCSLPLDPFLENILRFVVQFQKSQPHLVARAHLQLLLVKDGKLYGKDPFHEVISRALALPVALKDQEFHKNDFVMQLGQLTVNLIKILCTNHAWQRRKLGKILQDWGVISIQNDMMDFVLKIKFHTVELVQEKIGALHEFDRISEQLEMALRGEFAENVKSFSEEQNLGMKLLKGLLIWAEEQTYWIASRFLFLGFQLELYSPEEYCMVYWYMYIIFMNLLEKMQLRITFSSDACEYTVYMLAGLHNESRAYKISGRFSTEQESVVEHNFFREAQRIITSLRGSFSGDTDRLLELRQLEQVAERNRIALNVINQIGASDRSIKVSFEFPHHPFFAVAMVKRSFKAAQ